MPPPGSLLVGGRSAGLFSLHADVCVPAHDRAQLERLCRYVARPAIASERLEWLTDGRVRYRFKGVWRDGSVAVESTRSISSANSRRWFHARSVHRDDDRRRSRTVMLRSTSGSSGAELECELPETPVAQDRAIRLRNGRDHPIWITGLHSFFPFDVSGPDVISAKADMLLYRSLTKNPEFSPNADRTKGLIDAVVVQAQAGFDF